MARSNVELRAPTTALRSCTSGSRFCHQLVCKISICVLLVGVAKAQSTQKALLPVFAVDHHGDPVTGLTADSLTILDNKTSVSSGARLAPGADFPLRLGILIDTSNSQRNNRLYEAAVEGIKEFVDDVFRSDQDRVFFEAFATTVDATPLLSKDQLSGVSLPLQIGGGTALYDAIALACTDRMGSSDWQSPVRRVLVIVSDGEDNQSHATLAKAEAFPVLYGVVVFAISTNNTPIRRGDKVLERISETTGGIAYTGVSHGEIPKVFAQIRKQIEGMYYLTYAPPGNLVKDDVHRVDVKPAKGVKLQVRSPNRYVWNR
jgi:Ca-activated chloride channel family protein